MQKATKQNNLDRICSFLCVVQNPTKYTAQTWVTGITYLCPDYLGTAKKPPFSAPRQDRATRIGIKDATPWRARFANVCGDTGLQQHLNTPPYNLFAKKCLKCREDSPQPRPRTSAAQRGSSWCNRPHSQAHKRLSLSPWSRLLPVGWFWRDRMHTGRDESVLKATRLDCRAGVKCKIPVWVYDLFCDKVQIKPKGNMKRQSGVLN